MRDSDKDYIDARACSITQIFCNEQLDLYFVIPQYQRPYSWKKVHWNALYDDIYENDKGYFIGNIMCIKQYTKMDEYHLEVIDGQQRLTTLCLLLIAIYKKIEDCESKNENNSQQIKDALEELNKIIICRFSKNGLRLIPQIEDNNVDDFNYIFNDIQNTNIDEPKDFEKRKIYECYNYFLNRLEDNINDSSNKLDTLLSIKDKVLGAIIVRIYVDNRVLGYTLFSSLNNRGMQLTTTDLIKNTILTKAEELEKSCDKYYNDWQKLLEYITDDYTIQERFFRQYYNAFRNKLNKPFENHNTLGSLATRSNLLSIYDKLINKDLVNFMIEILECGKIYSYLILNNKNEYTEYLTDLNHIQGAPSYLLLMYLLKKEEDLEIKGDILKDIIKLLTRFFVRRNITDKPNTRVLTNIFMQIVSNIEVNNLKGKDIYKNILHELINRSASLEEFVKELKGDIYKQNRDFTRFILCDIAKQSETKERKFNLWGKDNKQYIWTIEHILPQGENLPNEWINMIANGNEDKAKKVRDKWVHKLGNLTITGYNSSLSNMPFKEKRDRKDDKNEFIGYKNGLYINKELAEKDTWEINDIETRTNNLVELFREKYKFYKDEI